MVDLGDEDPVATRDAVERELAEYSEALAQRPRIYALNKSDVTENRKRFDEVSAQFDRPFLMLSTGNTL